MNRGHALLQRGDAASLAAALAAYDEAITLLRPLPVAENPGWANSLGAALMNRGQLLHRLHGTARSAVALAAFDEAAELLRGPAGASGQGRDLAAGPWPRRNLAGTQLNRANLLLDLAHFPGAAAAARAALALGQPHERAAPLDAEIALKARRALCDALGQSLVVPGADQDTLASEAGDLADDALALVRHWADRGEANFAELALRFFRYGTQLYRFHQPQFLADFIGDHLPVASAEFRAVALAVLDAALGDLPHDRTFLTVGDPASERRRGIWHELAALRAKIAA